MSKSTIYFYFTKEMPILTLEEHDQTTLNDTTSGWLFSPMLFTIILLFMDYNMLSLSHFELISRILKTLGNESISVNHVVL